MTSTWEEESVSSQGPPTPSADAQWLLTLVTLDYSRCLYVKVAMWNNLWLPQRRQKVELIPDLCHYFWGWTNQSCLFSSPQKSAEQFSLRAGVNILPQNFPLTFHLSDHSFVSSHTVLVPLKLLANMKQENRQQWGLTRSQCSRKVLEVITLTSLGFLIEQKLVHAWLAA